MTSDRSNNIPTMRMSRRSDSGIFVKRSPGWHVGDMTDSPHRDDYYVFAALLDGEAEVTVDFRQIHLSGGEGIVLAPGQIHRPLRPDRMPTLWGLFVAPEHLPAAYQDKIDRYALATLPLRFDTAALEDISQLFGLLHRNIADRDFSRSIVAAIANRFCRRIDGSGASAEGRYLSVVLRFRRLLEERYMSCKTPAGYASMLNVSRVYLNEAVKAVSGLSAGAYIRAYVTLQAKRLLTHTSLDITGIAQQLGYDDASYFSRLFRKETGVSPTDYRDTSLCPVITSS